MSNNFRLPLNHNIYNKNRSVGSSNKENNIPQMNGNTYATPSEDDFSDDDDELLIAASQQVEKKLAQEKVGATARNVNALQLQGEIAILRDHNLKLAREKELEEVVKKARSKSAPVNNGSPYTEYKRCPGICLRITGPAKTDKLEENPGQL
ncbi:uncharacterized protein LOC134819799 [Bolinopsis microptera]|uniref:uncharacterized protein LOC134819799 n=1 Tax=Bolinopsis microptera TaxID=2820187 RepID=UPI00307A1B33